MFLRFYIFFFVFTRCSWSFVPFFPTCPFCSALWDTSVCILVMSFTYTKVTCTRNAVWISFQHQIGTKLQTSRISLFLSGMFDVSSPKCKDDMFSFYLSPFVRMSLMLFYSLNAVDQRTDRKNQTPQSGVCAVMWLAAGRVWASLSSGSSFHSDYSWKHEKFYIIFAILLFTEFVFCHLRSCTVKNT